LLEGGGVARPGVRLGRPSQGAARPGKARPGQGVAKSGISREFFRISWKSIRKLR